MKAIIYHQYGSPDVLQLREIAEPIVGDNDVLVRVRAASANPYDWHFMRGSPLFMRLQIGLFKPKKQSLGADLAGQVEAVGKNVSTFSPGDEVFGFGGGSFAEYVCVQQDMLALKPENLSFEQAAAVPLAGLTALQALRDYGAVRAGQKVIINGASGGVGTFAVQIAKSFGAEVTGVCSERNVDLVKSIGADRVFDYNHEDFTSSGEHYELMLDNVGNHSPTACRKILTKDATYLAIGAPGDGLLGPLGPLFATLALSLFVSQKMSPMLAKASQADLLTLKSLLESEAIRPVMDRHFTMSEVPEAIRYLEEGHVRGKIAITI
jgi:NADPH:quinone reductase-like Zn-dependent oxidoreductase